jgi:ABC-type nickel/cobalt efflux system permease component RcnA
VTYYARLADRLLGEIQGGFVRALATELRAGGASTLWLAFGLGALHALTPGHGKAALAAYFLGREARVGQRPRVALLAALLHVLSASPLDGLLGEAGAERRPAAS